MSRFMHIFKCQVLLEPIGEPMQVVIDANENVNGTLVLPVWEGSDGIAPGNDNGINRILKNQIDSVLQSGDFTGKAGSKMTLAGTEGGKALLIGLGKSGKTTVQDMREAGAGAIAARGKIHGNTLTVRFNGMSNADMAAFVEGMLLRDYSYAVSYTHLTLPTTPYV